VDMGFSRALLCKTATSYGLIEGSCVSSSTLPSYYHTGTRDGVKRGKWLVQSWDPATLFRPHRRQSREKSDSRDTIPKCRDLNASKHLVIGPLDAEKRKKLRFHGLIITRKHDILGQIQGGKTHARAFCPPICSYLYHFNVSRSTLFPFPRAVFCPGSLGPLIHRQQK
jgi:hypothetical protein